MEQKKVLRKLTLNKEEIVSLNSSEMESLKGGTNKVVRDIAYSVATELAANAIVNLLQSNTWWIGCTTAPVDNTVYNGGTLNEVVIRG